MRTVSATIELDNGRRLTLDVNADLEPGETGDRECPPSDPYYIVNHAWLKGIPAALTRRQVDKVSTALLARAERANDAERYQDYIDSLQCD